MSWNYRIIRHREKNPVTKKVESFFQIHEVYYDKKGVAGSVSKDAIPAHGETPKEVFQDLVLMLRGAAEFPVIDMAYFDRREKNSRKGKKG